MRLMYGGEKPSGQAEVGPEDETQRPKKNVMDRELYDVLGVEPEVRLALRWFEISLELPTYPLNHLYFLSRQLPAR